MSRCVIEALKYCGPDDAPLKFRMLLSNAVADRYDFRLLLNCLAMLVEAICKVDIRNKIQHVDYEQANELAKILLQHISPAEQKQS